MIAGLPVGFLISGFGYALVLHGLWELAQMRRLYTCWDRWGRVEGGMLMATAIGGDGLITVVVTVLAALLTSADGLLALRMAPLVVLVLLSGLASVILEWTARRLDLLEYRSAMPVVRIAGRRVGLSPLA